MAGVLTFKHENIKGLLIHAQAQWLRYPGEFRKTFGEEGSGRPAFWLVGDDGVYLMHNGRAHEGDTQPVVYAEEVNPTTMEFDQWWEAKREIFGGDDAVESFDAGALEQAVRDGLDLMIKVTENEIMIMSGVAQ